jgi:hypothetical protein
MPVEYIILKRGSFFFLPSGNISFRRPLFPALIEVLQEVDLSTTDVKTLFEKTCQKVKDDFKSNHPRYQFLNDRKVSAIFHDKLLSKMYLKKK